MAGEVGYQRRDRAAWLTLDRPAKRNAITPGMVADLHGCLDQADADGEVRSIVLTGAGPAFCAGADLGYFLNRLESEDGLAQFVGELLQPLAEFFARLRASPRPIIAAVNGPCAAGGLELLMCCDIVLAADTATFSDAHSRLGLAPAVGGAAGLVRAAGSTRAKRVLLTGDTFDAATMAEYGIVTEVVAPGELIDRTGAIAATLAARSPRSLAVLKAMVHDSHGPEWTETVADNLAVFQDGWHSPDLRAGIRAYLAGDEPRF